MAFQPFGFPFKIDSPLQQSDLKAAIRSGKRPIFDQANGARGWVLGPLICLWLSAYDPQGPMLLGWISQSQSGSRVVGRAGSDLNGLLMLVATMPVMAFAVCGMAFGGGYPVGRIVIVSVVYILICATVLVSKHIFRTEAKPLVDFLMGAATKR